MVTTEVLQSPHLNPALVEYLAGFFDVSGSITIEKNREYSTKGRISYNYPLRAEVERVYPETIDFFKSIELGFGNNRPLPSGKITKRWIVKANKARLLLETLGSHLRLKAGHWQIIQEYIDTLGNRSRDDSERLKTSVKELNQTPRISFAAPITTPYIAGVFDGHGHIGIHDQDGCQNLIAQIGLNNQPFMSEIGRFLGSKPFPGRSHGEIKSYKVVLHSTAAADFLERIQPYSIRHRKSIPAALEFQRVWQADIGKQRSEQQKDAVQAAQVSFLQTKAQH